jgi:hypothetical protein
MTSKVFISIVVVAGIILFLGYGRFNQVQTEAPAETNSDTESALANESERTMNTASVPEKTIEMMTLTGTYVCLPTLTGAATPDCAFGIKTDAGEYYAVNFGAGAGSMADFRAGERINANGTFIPSEELNPNHWTKFNSKGLFTVLEKL